MNHANGNGFWEVTFTAIWVNNTKANGTLSTAIIDTGTSLAYFPTAVFNSILKVINKGCVYSNSWGLYRCTCTSVNDILPLYV